MLATIKIPQPCSENWDAMQPDAQGRHCSSCAQTVIDFTSWELQDIVTYLKNKTGKHVCGRFLNSQLNQPFDLTTLAPKVISWHTDGWRKVAALIIVCFGLTSCMGKAADRNLDTEPVLQVMGDITTPGSDTQQKAEKQVVSETIKSRVSKRSRLSINGIGPNEPNITTMGAPEMEYPREVVPVRTDVPKFQPLIGPPEDTATEIK